MSEGLEIQNTSPVTTTGFRAAESCARDIFVEAISGGVIVVTEGRRRAPDLAAKDVLEVKSSKSDRMSRFVMRRLYRACTESADDRARRFETRRTPCT